MGEAATTLDGIIASLRSLRRPEILAELFCEMDDDAQAKFIVHVTRLMGAWGPGKRDQQLFSIGRHLRTCECSTPEARDFVATLADFTKPEHAHA